MLSDEQKAAIRAAVMKGLDEVFAGVDKADTWTSVEASGGEVRYECFTGKLQVRLVLPDGRPFLVIAVPQVSLSVDIGPPIATCHVPADR